MSYRAALLGLPCLLCSISPSVGSCDPYLPSEFGAVYASDTPAALTANRKAIDDITLAIQRSRRGGVIQFEAGDFHIAGGVEVPQRKTSGGRFLSMPVTVRGVGGPSRIVSTSGSAIWGAYRAPGKTSHFPDILIEHLELKGARHGLEWGGGGKNLRVHDVDARGCGGDGFHLTGYTSGAIRDCYAHRNRGSGFWMGPDVDVYGTHHLIGGNANWLLVNCRENGYIDGKTWNPDGHGMVLERCRNNHVFGTFESNGGYGLSLVDSSGAIEGWLEHNRSGNSRTKQAELTESYYDFLGQLAGGKHRNFIFRDMLSLVRSRQNGQRIIAQPEPVATFADLETIRDRLSHPGFEVTSTDLETVKAERRCSWTIPAGYANHMPQPSSGNYWWMTFPDIVVKAGDVIEIDYRLQLDLAAVQVFSEYYDAGVGVYVELPQVRGSQDVTPRTFWDVYQATAERPMQWVIKVQRDGKINGWLTRFLAGNIVSLDRNTPTNHPPRPITITVRDWQLRHYPASAP